MTKQQELDKLDANIRRIMLEATKEEGDTSVLPELTVVTNYLAKNNVVAEKSKSTTEEDIQKRLDEAKDRRENKVKNKWLIS